jgi:hypothetical protein
VRIDIHRTEKVYLDIRGYKKNAYGKTVENGEGFVIKTTSSGGK